jgi:hypothetical protein
MQPNVIRAFLVAIAVAVFGVSLPARADQKAECAAAYEASQEQRASGKLRDARKSLVTCSQAGCKDFIKKDCAKWLAEVDSALPTVVFGAKQNDKDLTDVRVKLGDEVLAESLDGKAIPMDPGTYEFVFENKDGTSKQVKFVVKEGQKSQNVAADFSVEKPEGGESSGGEGASISTADKPSNKTLAYVLMGVGVLGVAGFAYFGLSGNSEKDDLACADSKTCTDDDLDPIKQKYLLADISLGVGVVSLAVGTYLLVTSPKKTAAPPTDTGRSRIRFDVAPGPGGGFAAVSGSF